MGQHGDVSEPRKPVEQALDLLVYAPLGFLLEARRLLPELAERGHQQVNNQVTMARMVGRFAVQEGQNQAGKRLDRVQKQASVALADLGLGDRSGSVATSNGASPSPARTTSTSARPTQTTSEPTGASTPSVAASPKSVVDTSAGLDPGPTVLADDASLAVPDYDSLAASQVIPRLAGLSPAELEAVRAHEVAKRGRKTILNRVAQLQAD